LLGGIASFDSPFISTSLNIDHSQQTANMGICNVCSEDKPLRIFPTDHGGKHAESKRACQRCWEAWLSSEVEQQTPEGVRCLDDECQAKMSRDGTKRLSFVDT